MNQTTGAAHDMTDHLVPTAACPTCGGAVVVTSDSLGYGVTIEQCAHVMRCGYWRTLTTIRRPAHTRRPFGADTRRHRMRGERLTPVTARLLAALPTRREGAVTPAAVALAARWPVATVRARLRQLALAPLSPVERVRVVGAHGTRPMWLYHVVLQGDVR